MREVHESRLQLPLSLTHRRASKQEQASAKNEKREEEKKGRDAATIQRCIIHHSLWQITCSSLLRQSKLTLSLGSQTV